MDLIDLRYATFAPLVGEVFRARVDDEASVELELTEAMEAKGENRPDHAFSVLFRGPLDSFLPQRMYEIQHAGLGSIPIFLVPVAEENAGFIYEAIFTSVGQKK